MCNFPSNIRAHQRYFHSLLKGVSATPGDMENICAKCNQPITGIDSVTCRGYCGCVFHMTCSGATRALMNYFTSHRKNLFWMCDKCAILFENSHLRAITRHADEQSPLTSLTDAINNLQTEIKKISAKPVSVQSPRYNRWPIIGESTRNNKRPREMDSFERSSSECQSGRKQLN